MEATKRIRSGLSLEMDIPILALTAHTDMEMLDRCAEAGMDGYIIKPFFMGQLISTIEKTLDQPRYQAA